MADRPNFVVILSDQHNPRLLGCAGDGIVRTPHLDGLASQGVRFEHTYCAAPLCVPSRMTFLTGRHSSEIEVWTNGCMLASDLPTFAHGLGVAGYETLLGGRMHFVGPDQRHGFERRIIGDVLSPFPGGPPPDLGEIPTGTTGQSRRAVEISGPGRTAYQAYDTAVTDACCRFLERRDEGTDSRPFCLVVGYVLPHCPFICPRDLYEEYHDRVEIPQVPEGYLERLHPAVRLWREVRGVNGLDEKSVRRARAAYYGLVTFLDGLIGRVLQTLADTSYADNTSVVYLSDHGEMAGEHGMWWKSSFYEGSAGVPMIWSWPGRFQQDARIGQVASLLDVGATLLDFAGAEPLPLSSGRSLRGFLEGDGAVPDWPDEALSENVNGGREHPARMVRRGPWKLNAYHGYERPQLFNLAEDPEEFEDRAEDPACAEDRAQLLERVLAGWNAEAIEARLQSRQAGRALIRKWAGAVPHDLSDYWRAPAGCNVFPEK